MCGVYVLLINAIFISVRYVSQEGICLTESNQQIYDFYYGEIFEKERQCEPL